MKKLIIIGSALAAFSAINLFANGSFNNNGNAQSLYASAANADTTPKKKDTTFFALNDTTPKKKDTTHALYAVALNDTTPKKKDTTLFAYNTANMDTTPKKKDTTLFAYNIANNDTTPKKKDTTMALLAMK